MLWLKNVQFWVNRSAHHCHFLPSCPITVEEGWDTSTNCHTLLVLRQQMTTTSIVPEQTNLKQEPEQIVYIVSIFLYRNRTETNYL